MSDIKTKTRAIARRGARQAAYLKETLRELDKQLDRAITVGDCAAIEALAVAMNLIEDRLNALRAPSPVVRNGIKRYWSEAHGQYVTVPEE